MEIGWTLNIQILVQSILRYSYPQFQESFSGGFIDPSSRRNRVNAFWMLDQLTSFPWVQSISWTLTSINSAHLMIDTFGANNLRSIVWQQRIWDRHERNAKCRLHSILTKAFSNHPSLTAGVTYLLRPFVRVFFYDPALSNLLQRRQFAFLYSLIILW
jgi:hypothetical protein